MAFTYLLGWMHHDKWYYGVRYAKSATEDSLGKTYFSSSRYVHAFMAENGPPDVVRILKSCDAETAKSREERALRRLGVVKSSRWLNRANVNAFKGIVIDDNIKAAISKSRKGQMVGYRFYNNGKDLIRIPPGQEVPEGFHPGYLLSDKARAHVMRLNGPDGKEFHTKGGVTRRGKYKGIKKPPGFGEHLSRKLKGIARPYNAGENNPAKREESRRKISEAKRGCKHYTDGKRLIFVRPGSEPPGFKPTNMSEWKCISSKTQIMKS